MTATEKRTARRSEPLTRPYCFGLLSTVGYVGVPSDTVSSARRRLGVAIAYSSALLAATLFAACCHPTTVRVPVVVAPPPCLTELAPSPPAGEDDAAWSAYHARIEEWAARVEASCGSHLTEDD